MSSAFFLWSVLFAVSVFPKLLFADEIIRNGSAAIEIARPRLVAVFGGNQIKSEEPLVAKRTGSVWIVKGTLHCEPWLWEKWHHLIGETVCVGGVAEIKLAAKDGHVISLIHYQ